MAKTKSIMEISGSIGGINFYKAEGKTLARAKSSLTKEKVMKDPAFARAREQMSEFGGAAALGSTVRSIWRPFRKRAIDSRIAGRLNALLLRTLKSAPGLRGQRSFMLREHANLLVGFRLRKHMYLGSLSDTPLYNVSPDRRHLDLTFRPNAAVKPQKGATHYRQILCMGLISDWIYTPAEKRYQPVDVNHHGIRVHRETLIQPMGSMLLPTTLELPPGIMPSATDTLLVAWGIEYLQEVNGAYETLYENSAMEIGWVG